MVLIGVCKTCGCSDMQVRVESDTANITCSKCGAVFATVPLYSFNEPEKEDDIRADWH